MVEIGTGHICSAHRDADGVTSAVLLAHAGVIKEVFFPEDFGEVKFRGKIATLVVDQVPNDPTWDKICVDHHPDHPETRAYKLIHDSVPASLLVYRLVKDKIEYKYAWKVAVGLVGDGQPELIPLEIWENYPELLEEVGNVRDYQGRTYLSTYPVYTLLSSYINAPCRLGQPYEAYIILKNATSPYDIVRNEKLKAFKDTLRKEADRILKNYSAIVIRSVILWIVSSDYNVGFLASRLQSDKSKTVVLVNEKTRQGSIRGALATLLKERLNRQGFKVGGHSGFCGFKLDKDQTVEEFVDALRKVVP